MPYLLDCFYLVGLLILSPWLVYKAITTGKYRRGFAQKVLGLARSGSPRHPVTLSPRHSVIWFHGVSVGEIHLLRTVVARYRLRHPDHLCVVSTTTDTGYAEAIKHFHDLPVIYWPFDFSWAVRRALRTAKPSLVVLAEGELWPNFLLAAREQGVSVAIINGRMSPRSYRNLCLLRPLSRRLFKPIDLIAAQTEEYAARYRALGGQHVIVTGNIKYDGVQAIRDNPKTRELRNLLGIGKEDFVWIAGSTQAPEEGIALDIYRRARAEHPNLRLILVPRQKNRFEEVASLLRRSGVPFVRRTEIGGSSPDYASSTPHPVILVDTIGELGALWGLANVAFVGGSLDGKRGGQNMIEPAAYGAAVVFGPHVWNFKETAARLVEAGAAVQVQDEASLQHVISDLLRDAGRRERLGSNAREFVLRQQGATEQTLTVLEALLRIPLAKAG
jgi:3-deoxy-D-manno-octulosonic-acid transferase